MSNHTCGHCNAKFESLVDVSIHLSECVKNKRAVYCDTCKVGFDTLAEMQRHECLRIANPVNPMHYRSSLANCTCGRTIECIDVVRWLNMNIGNVIKYLWRADHKENRQEQLKKAHWYLRDEIRKEEPDFDANA